MFKLRRKKRLTLEAQLEALAACGVSLRPGRTVDELLISFPREEYEAEPFALLSHMIGGEVEAEPMGRHFSDDVWAFDFECVEESDIYVQIAKRLSTLAKGDFPIENPRGEVDFESDSAWLEFELDGRTERFEPRLDDDWADPEILGWFQTLLERRGGERRFTCLDLDGQIVLLGCSTPAELEGLRDATGLEWGWLE